MKKIRINYKNKNIFEYIGMKKYGIKNICKELMPWKGENTTSFLGTGPKEAGIEADLYVFIDYTGC